MVSDIEFVPQEVVKKENLRMNMFDQEHVRNLIERYGEDYEVGLFLYRNG